MTCIKIRLSVRKICEKCRQIPRQGRIIAICSSPRHKQRIRLAKGLNVQIWNLF